MDILVGIKLSFYLSRMVASSNKKPMQVLPSHVSCRACAKRYTFAPMELHKTSLSIVKRSTSPACTPSLIEISSPSRQSQVPCIKSHTRCMGTTAEGFNATLHLKDPNQPTQHSTFRITLRSNQSHRNSIQPLPKQKTTSKKLQPYSSKSLIFNTAFPKFFPSNMPTNPSAALSIPSVTLSLAL